MRIAAFAGGALGELLGFSKGLGWVFRRHRALALALLSGFLVGSLRKLWPWKENLELLFTHSDGRPEYLQANVSPAHPDPQLAMAALCAVAGAAFVTRARSPGPRPDHG